MSAVFWPAKEQLPGLDDEYAEVAGTMPVEGSLAEVNRVAYAPDPRFPTNGFLIISYKDGSDTRFRMKKSTAEKLNTIMRTMLPYPINIGKAEQRKYEEQYMGAFR